MKKDTVNIPIFLLKYLVIPVILIYLVFTILGTVWGIFFILISISIILFIYRHIIYRIKANKLYNEGNLTKATELLEKAVTLKKCPPSMKVMLGYALLKSGNIDKSYSILRDVVNSNVSKTEKNMAKSNLALVLWKQNKTKEAIEMLKEVLKEYKTTGVYGSLGYLLILNNEIQEAIRLNQEAYEFNSEDTIIQDNLGLCHIITNDFDKAFEIYNSLIPTKPSFPEAYYNYANLLEQTGDIEESINNYKKALDFNISFISVLNEEMIKSKICELEKTIENKDVKDNE